MKDLNNIERDFEIKLISTFDEIYGYPVHYKKWKDKKKTYWTFFTLGDNYRTTCIFRVALEPPIKEENVDSYPVILVEWSIISENVMRWDWAINFSALTTILVNPEEPIRFLKKKMDQLLIETGHKNVYRR